MEWGKIALVTFGVVGIVAAAAAGGWVAGASTFYFTGGTAPAIAEAGVAAGCLTPFATVVLAGIVSAVSTGVGGTYTFFCYQNTVPSKIIEFFFVSMTAQ